MPLLQIIRPPSEKVSPGLSHRIEEEGTSPYRVYHFNEGEWRLEYRHSYPSRIFVTPSVSKILSVPRYEKADLRMRTHRPVGSQRLSTYDLSNLPLYSVERAVDLCHLSYICHRDIVNDYLGHSVLGAVQPGFPVLIQDPDDGRAGCYLWKFRDERRIYAVFSGPAHLSSIASDLVKVQTESGSCGMINGAYAEFCERIEPHITHILTETLLEYDAIICTGHSLGGACATICSLVLSGIFPDRTVICVTFGSPMVGDETFSSRFTECVHQSLRFVNADDPVTVMPSLGGYVQASDALVLGTDGKVERCPRYVEAAGWNLGWYQILYHARSDPEHFITKYVDRVHSMIAVCSNVLQHR